MKIALSYSIRFVFQLSTEIKRIERRLVTCSRELRLFGIRRILEAVLVVNSNGIYCASDLQAGSKVILPVPQTAD